MGLNEWVAALLSDQTGLGMAAEELLCLYEFRSQNGGFFYVSLCCATYHRCDMKGVLVFDISNR